MIYEWDAFTNADLYQGLREDKINFRIVKTIHKPRVPAEKEKFKEELEDALEKESYDAVFSINFFDCIAEVCNVKNIMYISWAYDSPAMGGKISSYYLPNNRIFLFDSAEAEYWRKRGVRNIYYLDLAVDVKRYNRFKVIPMERLKYGAEISFVGQLYENLMQEMLGALTPYSASYLSALVDIQMRHYNVNLIEPLVNQRLVDFISTPEFEEIMKPYMEEKGVASGQVIASGISELLLTRVTNRERILLLSLLSKKHQVKLFSGDRHQMLENVIFGGIVPYSTVMPKVFKSSKINLNITKRSIQKGIPLRCLDIMGCRGFLLSNYQEDMLHELEDGKDMVLYYSIEDALEKADFYLKNDKVREEIASRGYKKVKDCYNYHRQFEKIWEIVGLK